MSDHLKEISKEIVHLQKKYPKKIQSRAEIKRPRNNMMVTIQRNWTSVKGLPLNEIITLNVFSFKCNS